MCSQGQARENTHDQSQTSRDGLTFFLQRGANHQTKSFLSILEPFFCCGSITGTYDLYVCVN